MSTAGSSFDLLSGWDTAYVCTFETINQAIVAKKSSPTVMSMADSQSKSSLQGSFGAWQLAASPSASGGNICLSIPLVNATLVLEQRDGSLDTSTLTHTYEVTVTLEFVNQTSGEKHLRVGGGSTASVTIVSSDSKTVKYAGGFLEMWLQDNLTAFAHVFTAATPDLTANQADWQWLMPESFDYAVNGPLTGRTAANSFLATLCKLKGGDPTGLPLQIGGDALPGGCHQALLVSQAMLLEHMIKPAVAKALYDTDETKLAIKPSPLLLTNTDALSLGLTLPVPVGQAVNWHNPKDPLGTKWKQTHPPPDPPAGTPVQATIDPGCLTAQFNDLGKLVIEINNLRFDTPDGQNEVSVDLTSSHTYSLSAQGMVDLQVDDVLIARVSVALTAKAVNDALYVGLASAMLQAVLSVAPAFAGVGGVVDAAAGRAATDAVSVDASAADQAAGAGAESAAVAEMGAQIPSRATAAKDLLLKIGKRMAITFSIGMGNFLITRWVDIQRVLAAQANNKPALQPTMHDLAAELARANVWNNTAPGSAPRCVSADIAGECLRLGIEVK